MAYKNIARIFAESLSEVGKDGNILASLEEELKIVTGLFNEEKELGRYFSSDNISVVKKKEFIDTLFSGRLSVHIINLLKSSIDFACINEVEEIYISFIRQADSILKRQRISVTTRFQMEDSTKENIKSSLGKKLNKEIILEENINEKILGGIIIKINDLLIDGSLANHLKKIKYNLIISKVGSDAAYED